MEPISAYKAEPYSYQEAWELAEELDLSEPVAVTLVRRGYRTPELARAFLEADESHSPWDFKSMDAVANRVLAAVRARERIVVHGDFDVDGVCSTSILVGALRHLDADCEWLIPDRIDDGYGVKAGNIERLAKRDISLIVTVDCGITSVDEVALAKSLGMDIVVTDHHESGPELPECPILHPALDGYPFADLCGTAVAWKLACAVREKAGIEFLPEDDLDLVALATVADVVPLVGENRSLVRRGLEEIKRARRPGMRALLKGSGCDPTRVDEGDLSFRLAPRINAAGRLYRADAGVELFLTDDDVRAASIAVELSKANRERRAAEQRADSAAEAARRELPSDLQEAPAFVLADKAWHPGVIGIVASRLAERHYRPVVVISLDGEGGGRGSGRSIPGFDLLAGLKACSEHLDGFGGHRAAAGLQLQEENLDAFREAFVAHATAVLKPEDLIRTERIDAMIGGAGMGLELAEQLEQVGPFGKGNPSLRLLVPSAQVSDVRTMGEGKHSRFSLRSGSYQALGVAFGRSTLGVDEGDPVDAAVRLEVNRWNGSVEPQVILRELYPLDGAEDADTSHLHACSCPAEEWWERFERELALDPAQSGESGEDPKGSPDEEDRSGPASRAVVPHNASPSAVIAELVSSGAGVLAVCADAARRAALANGASGLARFNGGSASIACGRCARDAAGDLASRSHGGLALIDYAALDAAPSLTGSFEHVVLVDAPPSPSAKRLATHPLAGGSEEEPAPGFLHEVWGEAEVPFALSALEEEFAQRPSLVAAFKDLRDAGEVSGSDLLKALRGSGQHQRAPEGAARCFRVLHELGIVRGSPDGGSGTVGVVSSEETNLERSEAFQAYTARYQESRRFLDQRKQR